MSSIAQKSFAGGEISPSLYARTDIEKYVTALRTCRNNIVMRHGGSQNRPGFYYVSEVKDSTKAVRYIPFIFNATQTYVLEFGDQYMRVIRNGANVEVSGVDAWANATGYVAGDLVSYSGVNYYCFLAHTSNQANDRPSDGTNYLDYWYALTGDIYEIPTDFLEADLATINYDQSADVITLTHPSYPTSELSRTGHTTWVLADVTFAPSQAAPTNLAVSGSAGTADYWVVTAINDESFEESLPPTAVGADTVASSGSPRTLSWTLASGASKYNVYKKTNGVYGYIGIAEGTSFVDNGITADPTDTPPTTRNPFSGADNYPSTSVYYQQRHTYANINDNTELVEMSKSGNYKNFTRSSPIQDDDAVSFNIVANQVNQVKHMIALQELMILTSSGEWAIQGGTGGVITPGEVYPKPISYYGCGDLRPITVGSSALFVQARSSIIRDLINDLVDGYSSDDLTIFATHLFEGYTIVDWAYQQVPNSILWVVRSDGALLGFTYVRQHKMFAWHKHDTEGSFENVVVVPESGEDVLYAVVNRTIDGSTVRYNERMETRVISDIKDAIFMDSALTYDGRHTGSTTMTLSGGTDWLYTETLTLTASAGYFVVGDVGKEIHLTGSAGDIVRCRITAYTNTTVVSVTPNITVPATMQDTAITTWGKAVNSVSGLDHLEGEDVSVFGDGYVEASPNNAAYDTITVSSGAITLGEYYTVIHVGLPYISDLETLNIDTPSGESLSDNNKLINRVYAYVNETRGLFAGSRPPEDDDDDPLEGLYEVKYNDEGETDTPIALVSDVVKINIQSKWNNNGRVFLRQVDPVPSSLLAVIPSGYVPFQT